MIAALCLDGLCKAHLGLEVVMDFLDGGGGAQGIMVSWSRFSGRQHAGRSSRVVAMEGEEW